MTADARHRAAALTAAEHLQRAFDALAAIGDGRDGHLLTYAQDGIASAMGYVRTFERRQRPAVVRIDPCDPRRIYTIIGEHVDRTFRGGTLREAVQQMREARR